MLRAAYPDPSPTSPPPTPAGGSRNSKVPNATGTTGVDLKERRDAVAFTVRQRPCPNVFWPIVGFAVRHAQQARVSDVDAIPPEPTPPTAWIRGAEQCGPSTASAGLSPLSNPPILLA